MKRSIFRLLGYTLTATTAAGLLLSSPVQAKDCASKSNLRANAETKQSSTIVDVAAGNSSFSTLVTAVKAAGLVEVLSGEGPYTVFAPTNEAFAALPEGTLERLLKPENKEELQKILTYHVIPASAPSSSLKSGEVKTVEGSPVKVQVEGSSVKVNDANVVTPDVKASNGTIHVIDRVILPPTK